MNRNTLPTHPHLVHPRTGLPLQAVMVGKRGPVWPVLGAADDDDEGDDGGDEHEDDDDAGDDGDDEDEDTGKGFPANTRVQDMTDAQKAAYWQHQSRKHENRAKAFKGVDLDTLRRQAELGQRLERETMTEHERAIEAAREAARAETILENAPVLLEAAFSRFAAGRKNAAGEDLDIEAIVEGLNVSKYLTDKGKPDTDKVKAYLDRIAPMPKKQTGPPARGMGNRAGGGDTGSVSAGSDLFRSRNPKAKISSSE